MIDLHCHILPSIDDGPKNWEMSIKMAKLAVDEGITHVLATPHHMNHHWMNPKHEVLSLVDEFQERLNNKNIPLIVFPGQEVHIHGEILQNIQNNEICFIDEMSQYVLIEFPTSTIPDYADRLFYEMQNIGITPVIVHPERNHAILKDPSLLYKFVSRDILAQVTAASYIGKFGKEIQKLSSQLIENNLVHFLASDAHNVTGRKFYMRKAYEKLKREYGEEKVAAFDQTTRDLVNGNAISTLPPEKLKKHKSLFRRFF